MRTATILAVSGIALLCLSLPASADWIETFDSYTLGPIIGQGNWTGWLGGTGDATVTNAQLRSASNSMLMIVNSDVVSKFSGYDSGQWVVEGYSYAATGVTGHTNFIIKCMYDDANSIDNDGESIDFNAGTGLVTMAWVADGNAQTLLYDQWVPFRFELDLDALTCKGYYNNGYLGSYSFGTATMHEIAAFDIWTYGGYSGAFYFDDLSIAPEPASMALLGIGGLALLGRRSRRSV